MPANTIRVDYVRFELKPIIGGFSPRLIIKIPTFPVGLVCVVRATCVEHDLLLNILPWIFDNVDLGERLMYYRTKSHYTYQPTPSLAYFILTIWSKVSPVDTYMADTGCPKPADHLL